MSRSVSAVVNAVGGAQNLAIAGRLAAAGLTVRGLSRGVRPVALPAAVDFLAVDPTRADDLARAYAGADVVVLTVPIDHRPGAREGVVEAALTAAARAGVRRFVLNTAAPVFDDRTHPVARVLGALQDRVLGGPVPGVVLRPTVYMDNFVAPWSLPAIVNDGVFAYPASPDLPISFVSHRSLGDFVAAVATHDGATGRAFDIGGPVAITGAEVAATIGRAIGRTVGYVQIPLEGFAAGMNGAFGVPAGDDIAALYAHMEANRTVAVRDPAGWRDLAVEPETLADWAARQRWSLAA
jgi:NAD(P)H dehydrogenase (quinone)